MTDDDLHVVTGAFGFSGKYIARTLLDAGYRVRTITDSYERTNSFGGKISAYPFNFKRPEKLVMTLRGASVLYNNYWIRSGRGGISYAKAVENTKVLINAAQKAGVRRLVQISITNPSLQSSLDYFRGKAKVERLVIESGISYAILRPAVIFGVEDVFINNLAWCIRNFPVFPMFGDGKFQLQPIHVNDLARLAVEQGGRTDNSIVDAVGPETVTYQDLVTEIAKVLGKQTRIISLPPPVVYWLGFGIGLLRGDVVITRKEIEALMLNLLTTKSEPVGTTKLSEWLKRHSLTLGARYANELLRRTDRRSPYEKL